MHWMTGSTVSRTDVHWLWLWGITYALVWQWLLLYPQGALQPVAALALVAVWLIGGARELSLARQLKRLMTQAHPGILDSYSVGSLNAMWNHARLLRASRDSVITDGSIASLSAQTRRWLLAVQLMFWFAPLLAFSTCLLTR